MEGLAETAGDSLRSLSVKSIKAWQWERALIYTILAFVIVMTILVLITNTTGYLSSISYPLSHYYGLLIGAVFLASLALVLSITGCPHLVQVWLSDGGISGHFTKTFFPGLELPPIMASALGCGNCSTYCEMGIDVKSYAQRGADIKRASCVGCGICSAVCPREYSVWRTNNPY